MEETEAAEQQVEIVDVTAESDDDDGVAPSEDAKAAASGKGTSVKTESNAKAEFGGPERTGLARDEAFERELGFYWDRSRIFTPAVWGGVDLGYVRDVTRCLTVVGEFDESRDDWRYQTANSAGVERYLRLFVSVQSFELQVLWMLLAVECM
ncbi:hypothetical protein DYB25_010754 [Aphanomyces astaci]|uniref:Uncharacterized protein n=1 Tax=Aphanomyces astaci TaxID=112090 RepID=A0A397A961_APHAT|nr:hypothetical protein DYB25_010754 [Aphanomyces astaci]RHY42524.1 hypothetical protein DYB34_007454 [Aphanomyces astaci]